MASLKLMNNEMAVSPIVATLVLIVVAVIGAVAVGTIMGTFSTDVSKNANTGQVASASNTEILVAGSTTVQPAALKTAQSFMAAHPGIKITVQGGGSGAGFQAINNGIVDIGTMSEDYTKNTVKYVVNTGVTLNQFKIGGSGIVVIAHTGTFASNNITAQSLIASYSDGTTSNSYKLGGAGAIPQTVDAAVSQVDTRSDASGTADTFYKVLGYSGQITPTASKGFQGNEGILADVQATTGALGFVDMGYVGILSGVTPANIQILGIDDTGAAAVGVKASPVFQTAAKDFLPSAANLKAAAKNLVNNGKATTGDYPLARGLYFLTNGEPNSVVNSYITYVQSPGAQADFQAAGMYSMADLA